MMCCAAKRMPTCHTVCIIDRKKENTYAVAPWSLLQNTQVLHYSCPLSRVGHTENLFQPSWDMGSQTFDFSFFYFSS